MSGAIDWEQIFDLAHVFAWVGLFLLPLVVYLWRTPHTLRRHTIGNLIMLDVVVGMVATAIADFGFSIRAVPVALIIAWLGLTVVAWVVTARERKRPAIVQEEWGVGEE